MYEFEFTIKDTETAIIVIGKTLPEAYEKIAEMSIPQLVPKRDLTIVSIAEIQALEFKIDEKEEN